MRGMSSTSIRFGGGELEDFRAAASSAGLKFNAWVRRACREAAALERAVAQEDSRVGLEREGWDDRPELGSSYSRPVEVLLAKDPERTFRPDPRPVSSKKPRR